MPANQYGPRIAVAERGPVVVFRDDRDGEFTTRASHRGNEGSASNPSPDAHIASDGDGRAWMAWVEEATLRTLSTSGDGEWTEGPHVSAGRPAEIVSISGAGGLVAVALGTPRFACFSGTRADGGSWAASTVGHPSYPAPEISVALVDTRAGTATDAESVLPHHFDAGVAVAPDRTVWLAGTDGERVRVVRRDPRGGEWSEPEEIGFRGRIDDVEIGVLPSGEVLLTAAGSSGVAARARAPVTGQWSDETTIAARHSVGLSLASYEVEGALPLQGGRAALAWISGIRVHVAGYRPAPAPLLPGEWSEPEIVARSYDVALAPAPGGLALAFTGAASGNVPSYRHSDVMITERTGDGEWSDPQRAHDEEMRAADKQVVTVFESGAGFDAVWRDERGAPDYDPVWLRVAGIESGPARTIRVSNWPGAVGAPDGSIALRWSSEDDVRVRVIAPSGEGSGFRVPDGVWPTLAATGPGQFVAAWQNGGRIRLRRYDEGAWLPSQSITAPEGAFNAVVGAGEGVGWIVWTDPAGEFGSAEPTSYRLRATRISADDATTVTLATRRAAWWPHVAAAGDRRGGLAAAWIEHRAGVTRILFGAPGETPAFIDRADEVLGISVAATPARDAVVAWRSWDEVHASRRVSGGELRPVPGIDPARQDPGPDGILCGGVPAVAHSAPAPIPVFSSIAAPPAPDLSFDESRRAYAIAADGEATRVWTLATDASEWTRGPAFGPASARTAISSDGRVGAAWVEGPTPERRVMSGVL